MTKDTSTTQTTKRPPTHGVACSEELWQRLKAYAATLEDRSPNWVVVQAIRMYLDARDGQGPAPKA